MPGDYTKGVRPNVLELMNNSFSKQETLDMASAVTATALKNFFQEFSATGTSVTFAPQERKNITIPNMVPADSGYEIMSFVNVFLDGQVASRDSVALQGFATTGGKTGVQIRVRNVTDNEVTVTPSVAVVAKLKDDVL